MNRLLLIAAAFAIAACATTPEPTQSVSVQASEPAADEIPTEAIAADETIERTNTAEESEELVEAEAPQPNETPPSLIPPPTLAESEIVCTWEVPTGSRLRTKVCRPRSYMTQKQEADQEIFNDIKTRTAIGASQYGQ